MNQEASDALPITPWLNKQAQPIWNHPDLPEEYKAQVSVPHRHSPPVVLTPKPPTEQEAQDQQPADCWYPQVVWENSPMACEEMSDPLSCSHEMSIRGGSPELDSLQAIEQVKLISTKIS